MQRVGTRAVRVVDVLSEVRVDDRESVQRLGMSSPAMTWIKEHFRDQDIP